MKGDGERCWGWVLLGEKGKEGRLCYAHRQGAPAAFYTVPDGERCEGRNRDGSRCRRRGQVGEAKRLCDRHRQPERVLQHGFYAADFPLSPLQRAYVAALAQEGRALEAEIVVLRLKRRRLLEYLRRDDLSPARVVAAARLFLRSTGTLRELLQQA